MQKLEKEEGIINFDISNNKNLIDEIPESESKAINKC
jgi:hypothetical protein